MLYIKQQGFVFTTSEKALSSIVCQGTMRNAAVRSERKKAVGGRQIDPPPLKWDNLLAASSLNVCICYTVISVLV